MYDVFLAIKSIDVFFILIIVILFFFCLFLLSIVKRLKNKVFDLELENKNILERKVMKQQNVDLVSIQNISEEKVNLKSQRKVETNSSNISYKQKKKIENQNKQSINQKVDVSSSQNQTIKTNNVDAKNVYTDNNGWREKDITQRQDSFLNNYQKNELKNKITSPISIEDYLDINQLNFDLNEFVKKSEKVVPKIRKQSSTETYLKELSDQMASELAPKTIELTDYEKEQEEHAVISYQELLSIKNQLNIVDDEEAAIDFIDDLKNLRNRLN